MLKSRIPTAQSLEKANGKIVTHQISATQAARYGWNMPLTSHSPKMRLPSECKRMVDEGLEKDIPVTHLGMYVPHRSGFHI